MGEVEGCLVLQARNLGPVLWGLSALLMPLSSQTLSGSLLLMPGDKSAYILPFALWAEKSRPERCCWKMKFLPNETRCIVTTPRISSEKNVAGLASSRL